MQNQKSALGLDGNVTALLGYIIWIIALVSLIIEKETGNRFILADGRLHPVLNYASARLLLPRTFNTAAVAARAWLVMSPASVRGM